MMSEAPDFLGVLPYWYFSFLVKQISEGSIFVAYLVSNYLKESHFPFTNSAVEITRGKTCPPSDSADIIHHCLIALNIFTRQVYDD